MSTPNEKLEALAEPVERMVEGLVADAAARSALFSALSRAISEAREAGRREGIWEARPHIDALIATSYHAPQCSAWKVKMPGSCDCGRVDALFAASAWIVDRAGSAAPEGETLEEKHDRGLDAAEDVIKALAAGKVKCICGKPATCVGAYEERENFAFGCDDCCGHGNEDGWCVPLAPTPGVAAP